MKIGAAMKRDVVSLSVNATLEQAIYLIVERHVGLLPLVDGENKLRGVIGLRDLLGLAWPRIIEMIANFDFIQDFGVLEQGEFSEELRSKPVSEMMAEAISVEEDCGLLRAAAFMSRHQLRDLPVVDAQGRLVGLASWVDVGTAFLANWCLPERDQ